MAAVAAVIASLIFAAQSEQAQAQPTAPQAPGWHAITDRGAGTAVADDTAITVARDKTVAARLAAARVRAAQLAAALTYTVRAGDTMSSVAQAHCGQARAWTGIYAASRARGMTARNANVLTAGQHLWLHCGYVPEALKFAPAPPPPPRPVYRAASTAGTGTYHRAYASAGGTYHGSGSMQSCIIARESGGNSQVMNSSSHYGLYQFSASTWAASGGSPADFGHASVAEQNRVFYNAVAARGYSDWTPYDGCLWNLRHRNALY